MAKKIVLLPGDGIGPEIMESAVRVMDQISKSFNVTFNYETADIGGVAVDNHDTPLPQTTIEACKNADSILLGAVGGPKWDNIEVSKRPEQGLLGIRKALNLFANLRPVRVYKPLVHASPLKSDRVEGADILIVRELTGGLYFGTPRERRDNGNTVVDTLQYTREEIKRIMHIGFQSAMGRSKKLTSVDKANVLESSRMWREIAEEVSKEYKDVELEHLLVDAAAMKLITEPKSFDTIVTENLFGDILSDEASIIPGTIGVLASASLNDESLGLFEPIHGSAPDIAGKGIANPISMILSVAMMLQHSLSMPKATEVIEKAVERALDEGYHTGDLDMDGNVLNTVEMTDKIIEFMREE